MPFPSHARLRMRLRWMMRGRLVRGRVPIKTRRIPSVLRTRRPNTMGFLGNGRKPQYSRIQRTKGVRRQTAQSARRKVDLKMDSKYFRAMGSRLSKPLQPNRELFDLFDKGTRASIVREFFGQHQNHNNPSSSLDFPSHVRNVFAISIRPTRFENLQNRLGPWSQYLNHWAGTNGELLDGDKMKRDGYVTYKRMKRGEIGCYDSHVRLWRHMTENNISQALILEDDADIHYGQAFIDRIHGAFNEISKHNIQWDILYLGHNNNKPPRKRQGCLGVPAGTQGLFCYILTLEGARKLLQDALPMRQAVDDYVYLNKNMRQLTLEPRLCWVVSIERSDTANIH